MILDDDTDDDRYAFGMCINRRILYASKNFPIVVHAHGQEVCGCLYPQNSTHPRALIVAVSPMGFCIKSTSVNEIIHSVEKPKPCKPTCNEHIVRSHLSTIVVSLSIVVRSVNREKLKR